MDIARWRDLPPHFGNWNSIYHTFRRWAKPGIFKKILQIVNKNSPNTKLIEIDSTYCKVHQSACSNLKNQASKSKRKNHENTRAY